MEDWGSLIHFSEKLGNDVPNTQLICPLTAWQGLLVSGFLLTTLTLSPASSPADLLMVQHLSRALRFSSSQLRCPCRKAIVCALWCHHGSCCICVTEFAFI